MIKPEDVTVIIPHLGATKEQHYAFNQCWISLRETVPNIKIIVAKNGLEALGEPIPIDFYDHAEKIALSRQGQCAATNAAAATVNTPWIFVTNDDMVYAPGWFEQLTNFQNFGDLMCVSPKLVEPRKGAPTFLEYFCGGAGGDFDKQKWLEFAKKYISSELIQTGFNLPFLISKELWNLIEGYDINYDEWGSNSDSDLEYKIRLAGVQPYQNTNCIVYHFSQTSGTFNPENQSHWQKNWDYFIEKWGFPRTDDGIWEANFHMPTKEEGRVFLPDWEGKYASS